MTCTNCPHYRCGSCPCVCSPGEHDMPCAVRCEGCGTSSPVELGPEEFCGECKPMPDRLETRAMVLLSHADPDMKWAEAGDATRDLWRARARLATDDERANALSNTAGANYDCNHPGFTYCGGCVVKIDGEAMLADLREQGWELVRS